MRIDQRRFLISSQGILAVFLFCVVFSGQLPAADPVSKTALRKAVSKGAELIVGMQDSLGPDGAVLNEWPYEGVYRVRSPRSRKGIIPIGYRVGGTAICSIALLKTPAYRSSKAAQAAVKRARDYIVASLKDPLLSAGFKSSYDVRGWGHAYALQFLLEARESGKLGKKRAYDEHIRGLVAALEETEIPRSGGWNYSRRSGALRASPPSTFMTAATLQALFLASASGFKVDPGVIDRALDSLEEARLDSGAFQYSTFPGSKNGRGFEDVPGAVGRMPLCEVTLYLAGRGKAERIRSSLEAFFEHWGELEKRRKKTGTHEPPYMIAPYYFFFAHYYAAQAIEFLPSKLRDSYRQRLYKLLWQIREKDGGWNDRVFPRSKSYGTAMTILSLLQPGLDKPPAWKKK